MTNPFGEGGIGDAIGDTLLIAYAEGSAGVRTAGGR